ncbi:efflux RND transporter permease subunit [Thermomonas sp. HDW16]|uniref:efflux RND transporter permease subunit n=1 Tax=Thermomonas sp. HDW16 TaxID=2714945 RepID=UPI00140DF0C8|nr:efflux RND transporter permease subunit [Thermomonas sp. HDW16]QIL19931.1 efflux RND transporter permease subunit [Thermomonas sp. HDW16]
MKLSDLSIKRPVLAVVMSLLLIVLGTMSFLRLTLRELPAIDPPIVSVQVDYPGASASVVETRITQTLEDALSGIEGINTIDSSSQNGASRISIEFYASRDIEAAANDVRNAVSRVADRMPEEADAPEISKVESDSDPIIWLNLRSANMDQLQLSDYAQRYLVDRFSSLQGVAQVRLGGSQRYAMRVWLDGDAMAARGLTTADIESAMRAENVELGAGRIESKDRDFILRVARDYTTDAAFAQMPIAKGADGYVVRLGDVAKVALESSERRAYYHSNGEPALGIGIVKTSTANSLDVADEAKAEADRIRPTLPKGTDIYVAFDTTTFISASVERVYETLLEAVVLVLIVIWLFLGSVRAALIPAVTVPVCVIASFIALYAFGFSINLLTLLALVLCIGLVVDDAIVVVENIQRRVDLGEPPLVAARRGTAQVAFAVLATTAVLVAVFLPVGFLQGNTGRLFRELSVALAAAVVISAFVALTLTPMMASKLLRPHTGPHAVHGNRVSEWLNARFERFAAGYRGVLDRHVHRIWLFGGLMLAAVIALVLLFKLLPSELAPAEDRGSFQLMMEGPEGAGFDYTVAQMKQVEAILAGEIGPGKLIERANPRVPGGFGASEEMHTGRASIFLVDWDKRTQSTAEVAADLEKKFAGLTGVRVRTQVGGGLVRTRGQPFQMVLGGPDYAELAQWRDIMLAKMADNPGFVGPDSDYKETRPQMRVVVDKARAADLGVSATAIGTALETMMGGRRVTTFVDNGEEYDVMLQADRKGRASTADLDALQARAKDGSLVPLSNLVTLKEIAEPGTYNRFNRLRSITLSARLAQDYPLGEAVAWAQQTADASLPDYAQISWKGESRELQQSGGEVLITFALALLIVYLALAAQFESFLHPLVIMLTVPLGVLGALLGLWVTGGTMNLFSQIGIVMLVGLAAKNGILIVEFANQLRDAGRSVHDAIIEAASVRLRPILMTSIATIMGALPLVIFGGPGSASRGTIGVVVVFGVAFSTLLSLFVVPAFYALLAKYTRSPEELAHQLDTLEATTPEAGGHA